MKSLLASMALIACVAPAVSAPPRAKSPKMATPTMSPRSSTQATHGGDSPIATFFGQASGERFGAAVGLRPEGLLVGINRALDAYAAQGAVEMIRRRTPLSGVIWDGDNVNQQSDSRYEHEGDELPAQADAYLGYALDTDRHQAVVGMRGFDLPVDVPPLHFDDGGAIVLRRSSNEWRLDQEIILMNENGEFISDDLLVDLESAGFTSDDLTTSGWQFGHDVAIHGNLMAISAPYANVPQAAGQEPHAEAGLVLIFNNSSGDWEYEAMLSRRSTAGSTELPRNFDYFGHSIALHNDLLVIGAPNAEPMDEDLNDNNGFVYVFHRGSNGHWKHVETIRPTFLAKWFACGRFGWSVDISGRAIAIGQPGADNITDCPPQLPYHSGGGRAWAYEPDVNNQLDWTNESELYVEFPPPSSPWPGIDPGAQYGWSVAISPCHLAVGAPGGDDDLLTEGSTYLWERLGINSWNFADHVVSPIGEPTDQWGHTVSVNANILAIGGWRSDASGLVDSGAAELWRVVCDCNNNGNPDHAEIEADPSLDCDDNGFIDSCEIAWDPSKDAGGQANGFAACEADGVLDSCQISPPGSIVWHADDGGHGHAFEIIIGDISAADAAAAADVLDDNADLASLTTWNEASFVAAYIEWDIENNGNVWLGGVQDPAAADTTSDWSWRTGNAWTWARWDDAGTNQPDTAGSPQTTLMAIPAIDTSEYIWDWDDAADGDSAAGWLIEYNRDCNDNGRLDESDICEDPGLDCDNDGRIDSCMVAESVVADCNQNGRPDSCDIDFGAADCNANGVPDTCDLDSGTSADCNANGVPDECDIDDGTSDDLNGTGIPDECELLVINEVLIDPQDDLNGDGVIDAGDQFVEIVNYTEESVDLTGWLLLNDGSSWHVFGGTILESGCVIIVFNEATASTIYEPATVLSSTSTDALVSPSSGFTRTISLFETTDAGYALVDDVTYGTEVLQIDGASIARCADLVGDFVPHNDDGSECFTGSGNMHSPGRQINGDYFPGECAVDLDGDGVLDLFDNCVLFNPDQADCDGNGIGDVCDIQDHIDGGGSHEDLDCNWNWILDECEPPEFDCNNNGLPDVCEVNDGTALDCNANGLLDECELDSGFSPDCNGNGIPDVCDINSGLSVDCNDNDVPDECDLLDPDQDTNGNGVLDECECNSPCDVNTDGLCTIDDLLDIIKGQGCSAPGPCPGDFNGDGNTDVNDILDYFAAGC